MYVHIGKDIIIKKDSIISILDIESILKKKKIEQLLEDLNIKDKYIDISENNNKKTIILLDDNKVKAYISSISSITLAKRAQYKKI